MTIAVHRKSRSMAPFKRTAWAAAMSACLALMGCQLTGPGESDVTAIVMEVQSELPAGPPESVKLETYDCRLMNHGQAHECRVEFSSVRDGVAGLPRRLNLIVRETDGGWRLISHETPK